MLFLFIAYLLWVNRFAFAQSVADEHDRLLFQWQVVDPRARRLHSEVVLVLDVDLAVGHARHLRVLGVNIRVIFFKSTEYNLPCLQADFLSVFSTNSSLLERKKNTPCSLLPRLIL